MGNESICPFCGTRIDVPFPSAKSGTDSKFELAGSLLKRYLGYEESVTIPEGIVEIGDSAFKGNTFVKSVTLSSTIVKIGKQAFFGCSNLSEVNGLSPVREFGEESFRGAGLESVELSDNVQTLGKGCFSYMPALKRTVIDIRRPIRFESTFIRCPRLSDVEMADKNIFFPSLLSYSMTPGNPKNLSTLYDAFMGTEYFHSLQSEYSADVDRGICPVCHGALKKSIFKKMCPRCNIDYKRTR